VYESCIVPPRTTGKRRKKLVDVLEYTLGRGRHEQAIILQAVRNGQPVPDEFTDKPELYKGLELYFFAFFDLITEKPSSEVGLGKIPWSSKYRYGYTYLQLEDEDLEDFFYVLNKVENAYDDIQMANHKKQKEERRQNRLPARTPKRKGGR